MAVPEVAAAIAFAAPGSPQAFEAPSDSGAIPSANVDQASPGPTVLDAFKNGFINPM